LLGHLEDLAVDELHGATRRDGEDEGEETVALQQMIAATRDLECAVADEMLRTTAEAIDGEERERLDEVGEIARPVRPNALRPRKARATVLTRLHGELGAKGRSGESTVHGFVLVRRLLGRVERAGVAARTQRQMAGRVSAGPVGEHGVADAADGGLGEEIVLAIEEHREARLQGVVVESAIVEEARLHELIRLAGGIPGAAQGEGDLCALSEGTGERR
jgi:hypothetical protein